MRSQRNTPPGGDPGAAKASLQNKRRFPLDSRVAEIRQRIVSAFYGEHISTSIAFSGHRALLFIARADGLRPFGGAYPSRRSAFAASGALV